MPAPIVLRLPVRTPSLNEWQRLHWRAQAARVEEFVWLFLRAKGRQVVEPFRVPVVLTLTRSYRSVALDDDNAMGGAKPLVDAIKGKDELATLDGRRQRVRTGLRWIVEDSPAWCRLVVRQVQDAEPYTWVRIEARPAEGAARAAQPGQRRRG